MNKKFNVKVLFPAAVLLIICIVISAALALTNSLTKDKIAQLSAESEKKSMRRLLPADSYKSATVKYGGKEYTDYTASDSSGDTVGYVITVDQNGYGGAISVMTAIDSTTDEIVAVEVLDASSETPGLGQNTAKEDWYSQFDGKSGELTVGKDIDAVTGATISSKAVTKAVNTAQEIIGSLNGGEKK